MLTRRQSLKGIGLAATCTALGAPLAIAEENSTPRLIVMILRGGLDGLAAVAPYGDPDYARMRSSLALAPPTDDGGLRDLDGMFGLHPNLKTLHGLYHQGALTVIQAAATPYRDRSHFEAQNVLEQGAPTPYGLPDGWLGRALAHSPANVSGLALGGSIPLILQGSEHVTSWTPSHLPQTDSDTVARLMDLYHADPLLGPALQRSLETEEMIAATRPSSPRRAAKTMRPKQRLDALLIGATALLSAQGGAEIGVLDISGWDTHANQGTTSGVLATRLGQLDSGIARLKNALGNIWHNTVILIVSEFGRTVAMNGTRGTDHGTAGLALLAGGAVNGGQVIVDWPGLAQRSLYEGRDLKPTTDLRQIFKGILHDHLSVSRTALDNQVFPDTQTLPPQQDLVRA